MNQRPTGLSLSQATVGFLQYKSAEGLSPVTVSGYDHDLKLWIEYQGDVDVAAVETTHILAYLNHLRTDYANPDALIWGTYRGVETLVWFLAFTPHFGRETHLRRGLPQAQTVNGLHSRPLSG